MEKLIFNCSLPKAGSELIQVLLHQNPRIYGSSTSPLLEFMFASSNVMSGQEVKSMDENVTKPAFENMCRAMVKGWYSDITDRPIIVDKNRGWTHYHEWTGNLFENSKTICMVRDLRSILASFERTHRKNRHSRQCPDRPGKDYGITVDDRIKHFLVGKPLGIALSRMKDAFQRGVDKNVLFVKYEDLCNYPDIVMEKIYEYLEEEPFKHDFNNIKKEVYEDDKHFGIFGSHSVKKKLRPIQEKSWMDVFSEEQANKIYNQNIEFFKTFKYKE
ncbi:MAG: sulfotransferase [Candidatus Sifarchaeia archaeon]|jgi:sulfotransferase